MPASFVDADTHRDAAGDDETAEVSGDSPEPGLASAAPLPSQTALALRDIIEGARMFHVWSLLGWQDIRQRYRRSTLGPFWLTISMGILVGMLGVLDRKSVV